MGKHCRNGQMDGRLFVSSLSNIDSGLCARTWIHVNSRSQVSVYRTIGSLVLFDASSQQLRPCQAVLLPTVSLDRSARG